MNALVSIRDGEVRASSQDVAAAFEKAHKDVLRAIDKLIELAPEISQRNFAPRDFQVRGRNYRGYEMDRDGFSLLAMGFTGAKALDWKIRFLDAFRRMEGALRSSLAANDEVELPAALATADSRDAARTAISMVRLMKEMNGVAAARALWAELKLPVPADLDRLIAAPEPKEERDPGPLWMWANEREVRPNPAATSPSDWLWFEYQAWCSRHGFTALEPPVFRRGLRNLFGKENRNGLFGLSIGKPLTNVFDQGS